MQLLIRQASGLTAKLVKALSKRESDTVPVLIDGPYGGPEGDLTLYEHVILVAGGTGITFVKPVLEWLLIQMQYKTTKTSTVEVVWSVRSAGALPETPTGTLISSICSTLTRVTVYRKPEMASR